jgi:hypothetical protein
MVAEKGTSSFFACGIVAEAGIGSELGHGGGGRTRLAG